MAKEHIHGDVRVMGTFELIKRLIQSKLPVTKESVNREKNDINPPPSGVQVNHIAIVLDDVVQEVIRADNRMAALMLSDPTFVEFNPEEISPIIGKTKHFDGFLINPIVETNNESTVVFDNEQKEN